jgi:ribulose-phosphate 3-epimerase
MTKNQLKGLYPSILNANFAELGTQMKLVEAGGANGFHLDVMDGNFVPNLSLGPSIVESLRPVSKLPFDCHLMVEDAALFIPEFAKAGANNITIHLEGTNHIDRQINQIKELGCTAGIAINPGTDVRLLKPLLPLVDLVLIMSVNPGYGGQRLIPYCLDKVAWLKEKQKNMGNFIIQIDGGVKMDNVADVLKAGVDSFVVGSAIFKNEQPRKATKEFNNLYQEWVKG